MGNTFAVLLPLCVAARADLIGDADYGLTRDPCGFGGGGDCESFQILKIRTAMRPQLARVAGGAGDRQRTDDSSAGEVAELRAAGPSQAVGGHHRRREEL